MQCPGGVKRVKPAETGQRKAICAICALQCHAVPLLQCRCLVSLSGGLACQSRQSKQHFDFFHLSTMAQRMVVYRISKVAGFGSKALIMLPVIYLLALHLLPSEFRLEGVRLNEERRMESKNIRKSEIELSLGVASGEVLGYRIDRVSNAVNSSVDMVDAWDARASITA